MLKVIFASKLLSVKWPFVSEVHSGKIHLQSI